KLVARWIDGDRIAGLERRALGEKQRKPFEAGAADGVDLPVAGDHVSEPRLQGGAQRELVGGAELAALGKRTVAAEDEQCAEQQHGARRAAPLQTTQAAR